MFTGFFFVISQGQFIPGGEEVQCVFSLLFSVPNMIVFNSPPFLPKANNWLSASYSPGALLFQAACLNFLEESSFFQSDFKRELSSGHGWVTKDYFFTCILLMFFHTLIFFQNLSFLCTLNKIFSLCPIFVSSCMETEV